MELGLEAYCKDVSKYALLSKEEEAELCDLIKQGDEEARERMIKANLRLVWSVANKYNNKFLSKADLIQEGTLGLMKAVDKYDADKGRFATYATYWINHAINIALYNGGYQVRLPKALGEDINKVRRAEEALIKETHKQPTVDEIAERANLAVERVELCQNYRKDSLELDKALDSEEEDGATFADILTSDVDDGPGDMLEDEELKLVITKALSKLDALELDIIINNVIAKDKDRKTYAEIGEKYNLSYEGVRLRKNKVINKLRKEIGEAYYGEQFAA